MRHHFLSRVVLILIAAWLVACSRDASAIAPPTEDVTQATPAAVSHGGRVEGYDSLMGSLRSVGATAEPAGEILQPFFSVTGQMIKVNGGDVLVFEFESEVAAKEEAALVSPDGGSVGTSMMSWMATPHFYLAGKLLVLYVGDDTRITALLEAALGPQFAGGMSDAASPTASCPTVTVDTPLLTNEPHGYCTLYPAAYDVQHPNPDETVLVVGSLLNVEQPRAYIAVQDAAGRTAAQVADSLTAGFESGPFSIVRTSTTVAGVEAIVLDHMPGQDINRVVVMVNGERLYTLTFAPADESVGDVFGQLEELYTTVVSSFHFLPQSSAATVPAGEIVEEKPTEP